MQTSVAHPVGERLKEARKANGLSLNQVSEGTKIASRYLSALEDGCLERCPGAVYTRGFIKLYARYVNLDANEVVAEFDAWERRTVDASEPYREPEQRASLWRRLLGSA